MIEPAQLAAKGKKAFANKQYDEAAEYFRQAAHGYSLGRAGLLAAEMRNNLSVALLQSGKPAEALEAALGTDQVFANANDLHRQAMAMGNQAAALEELHRYDEAITIYERSAELFKQVNDGDMHSLVMKSAAAIRLKTGRVTEAAFKMMGSIDVKKNPTLFERVMKFFMRFIR